MLLVLLLRNCVGRTAVYSNVTAIASGYRYVHRSATALPRPCPLAVQQQCGTFVFEIGMHPVVLLAAFKLQNSNLFGTARLLYFRIISAPASDEHSSVSQQQYTLMKLDAQIGGPFPDHCRNIYFSATSAWDVKLTLREK